MELNTTLTLEVCDLSLTTTKRYTKQRYILPPPPCPIYPWPVDVVVQVAPGVVNHRSCVYFLPQLGHY